MNEAEQKECRDRLSLHSEANRIATDLMQEIFKTAQGYDIKLNPKAFLIERVKKYLEGWI